MPSEAPAPSKRLGWVGVEVWLQEWGHKVIGIDVGEAVEEMVAIGYPAATKSGHPTASFPYLEVTLPT